MALAGPAWGVFFGAAVLSAVFIMMLRPVLQRYALARPNARSSHSVPTPQGGGLAIVAAIAIVLAIASVLAMPMFADPFRLAVVIACAVALAAVGATDDIWPLEPLPRLLLQSGAILIVVAFLPSELRIIPVLPWWGERFLMTIALLWLVNLVNFMDGIDWMTVAEIVPVTAALAGFGLMGALSPDATLAALALCGGMIGFAPFNRPVARLFLGDVGSLPTGLLLGWLLILLAERHLAAALLLPLYYVADATITLLRRLINREPVMQAHRSHFYQRAMLGGLSVSRIVGWVFLLNIALAGLSAAALLTASLAAQAVLLITGAAMVGALLWHFETAHKATATV